MHYRILHILQSVENVKYDVLRYTVSYRTQRQLKKGPLHTSVFFLAQWLYFCTMLQKHAARVSSIHQNKMLVFSRLLRA